MKKLLLLLAFLAFYALPSHANVAVSHNGSQSHQCTNGVTNCNYSVGGIAVAQHETMDFVTVFCWNAACTSTPTCTAAVADGSGNTYNFISAASTLASRIAVLHFVVNDLGATTPVQPSLTVTGTGCGINFMAFSYVTFTGADNTGPVDTSVSNGSFSTSATPSLTSAGNVSRTGEIAVCAYDTSATNFVFAGSFSSLLTANTNAGLGTVTGPTKGATTTCNGTMTSNIISLGLLSIQPPFTSGSGVTRHRGGIY